MKTVKLAWCFAAAELCVMLCAKLCGLLRSQHVYTAQAAGLPVSELRSNIVWDGAQTVFDTLKTPCSFGPHGLCWCLWQSSQSLKLLHVRTALRQTAHAAHRLYCTGLCIWQPAGGWVRSIVGRCCRLGARTTNKLCLQYHPSCSSSCIVQLHDCITCSRAPAPPCAAAQSC